MSLRFFYAALRATCRIEIERPPEEKATSAAILCFWHENMMLFFVAFGRLPPNQVWMCHPHWRLAPFVALLRLMGARSIVFGSSGNQGRAAADRLAEFLRDGASTVMAPDGPAGPPKQARNGVFHLCRQTGAVLVPMTFHATVPVVDRRSWDGKIFPRPLSRVRVRFLEPVDVSGEGVEVARRALQGRLADGR